MFWTLYRFHGLSNLMMIMAWHNLKKFHLDSVVSALKKQ